MMLLTARRLFLFATVVAFANVSVSHSDAQTWTGLGGDNKWGTSGNWDSGVPGSGSTANFVGAGNSNTNISLNAGSQPIGSISFDTASAAAYNLGVLNSGDTFSIDGGGTISMGSAVTTAQTINAVIAAGGALNINLSSAPTAPGLKIEGGIVLNGVLNLGPVGTTSGPGASGAITIDRPITGDIGGVNSTIRTGSLNLNAQSTYSGGTIFNATNGGEQPAIRFGVDTVGSPGSVVSGPLGTGLITTASGNPPVFQPVGGDRTIANEWLFTNAIFVGSTASAPLVDTTPHNLTLTGLVTLGTTSRILTNNFPAGVTLNFGSPTVTSNLTLGSTLTFQTQTSIAGTTGGGKTVINDPIVDGTGNGALTVQNSAIVVMNNANNSYSGVTTITGTGGTGSSPVPPNPTLLVMGSKTGTGNVVINTRCNSTTSTDVACSAATADPTKPLRGVGVLGGTGSVAGNVNNTGIIAPGAVAGTPGTLTLTGNLTDLSVASPVAIASHWAIDLSGALADKLVVGGNISLSAVDSLDVTGTGNASTTFTIATYTGTLTGTFDTLNIPSGYTIDYGSGTNSAITLTSPAAGLTGDFNSDGKVDAGDYATWRKNETANATLANDNGVGTQAARFSLWRANFGKPPGAGSGGAAVPEPGALLLLLCAIGPGLVASRRVKFC